jgi:hypothetical protein
MDREGGEFRLGSADRVVFVFALSKLLKLLDSSNKIYKYSLFRLNDGGIALLLKTTYSSCR